nr:hypothetical protein [Jiangella asiatica]
MGIVLRDDVGYAGRLGGSQQVIRPLGARRMVVAAQRSGCLKSGSPACTTQSAVIWCTIESGRAAATVSPTDAASGPSITTASAPSCCSCPTLAGLVVVAVTW